MRRSLYALITVTLLASAGLLFTGDVSYAADNTARVAKKEKILVVYFSLQGNTRKAARILQTITGGDIAEIISLEDYLRPDVEDDAKRQIEQGYMPEIKKLDVNPRDYDIIYIGSPVWWFTCAPPVKRFLHDTNFAGKRIVPFCTCISDYGHIFDDFRKGLPGAKVGDGIFIYASELSDEAALTRKLRARIQKTAGK